METYGRSSYTKVIRNDNVKFVEFKTWYGKEIQTYECGYCGFRSQEPKKVYIRITSGSFDEDHSVFGGHRCLIRLRKRIQPYFYDTLKEMVETMGMRCAGCGNYHYSLAELFRCEGYEQHLKETQPYYAKHGIPKWFNEKTKPLNKALISNNDNVSVRTMSKTQTIEKSELIKLGTIEKVRTKYFKSLPQEMGVTFAERLVRDNKLRYREGKIVVPRPNFYLVPKSDTIVAKSRGAMMTIGKRTIKGKGDQPDRVAVVMNARNFGANPTEIAIWLTDVDAIELGNYLAGKKHKIPTFDAKGVAPPTPKPTPTAPPTAPPTPEFPEEQVTEIMSSLNVSRDEAINLLKEAKVKGAG